MVGRTTASNVAAWVCGAVLAVILGFTQFMFLLMHDTYGPEGVTGTFMITDIPPSASESLFTTTVEDQAHVSGVNVYKSFKDSSGGGTAEGYYAFVGKEDELVGDLSHAAFPTFRGMSHLTLRSHDQMPLEDVRGGYLIQGAGGEHEAFIAALESAGFAVYGDGEGHVRNLWLGYLLRGPGSVAVVALVGTFAVVAANLVSSRLVLSALRLSAGSRKLGVFLREAGVVLAPLYGAALAPTALLLIYSHTALEGYYSDTILVMGGVASTFALASTAAAVAVILISSARRPLGAILKGARPDLQLAAMSAVVIVLATLAGGAAAGSVNNLVREHRQGVSADSFRAAHPEYFRPRTGHALVSGEGDALFRSLGATYSEAERAGGAVLSDGTTLDAYGVAEVDTRGHEFLLMNSNLLTELGGVSAETEASVDSVVKLPGGVAVLLPTSLSESADMIDVAVTDRLTELATLQPDGNTAPVATLVVPGTDLGTVPRLDLDDTLGAPMHMIDPIVVVTDVESGVLPADLYAASGTFSDRELFDRLIAKNHLSTLIVGTDSIAEMSADQREERMMRLRFNLVGVSAMAIALTLAVAVLAAVRFNRMMTAIFLRSTTGSSFVAIHGAFLTGIGVAVTASATVGSIFFVPAFTGPQSGAAGAAAAVGIGLALTVVCVSAAAGTSYALSRNLNRYALEMT